MLISVTDLSEYLYCPRKLYLKKVLKIFEPVNKYLVLGSIRHYAHDSITKIEEKLVKEITGEMSYDDLVSFFKEEHFSILRNAIIQNKQRLSEFNLSEDEVFDFAWPLLFKEASLRTQQIHSFMKTTKRYGAELWEAILPKIMSEVRLESEKLQLKGVIDRLEVYDDSFVPYELKTGSAPREGFWPSHRIQLAAYMVLVENQLGNIKEGIVYYLDSEQTRQLVMNPFLEYETQALIKKIINLYDQKRLPGFCDKIAKCRNCGLRDFCVKQNI